MNNLYKNILLTKLKATKLMQKEDGFGTVEMVIMLFVLITLVIIFRNETMKFIESYFSKMDPNLSLPAVK